MAAFSTVVIRKKCSSNLSKVSKITCKEADFLTKLTSGALIWSLSNRLQNICQTILCGRSCYEISTRLLREVFGGVCSLRIAEMLFLKGALKDTLLHLKKNRNKKLQVITEPPYTLYILILAYAICRFKAKVVTYFLLVTIVWQEKLSTSPFFKFQN